MGANLDRLEIVVGNRLLPLRAPSGRVLGHRMRLDRPPIGGEQVDKTAADEIELSMVEIVAVELVHHHAQRACADEWIHYLVVEKRVHRGHDLVAVVLADDSGTGPDRK